MQYNLSPLPTLSALIAGLPDGVLLALKHPDGATPVISGVRLDSRSVNPGDLFVALSGGSVDGHRFIPDAIQRGAAAIAGTYPAEAVMPAGDRQVPYLQVTDGRLALAYLAAGFYGFPAHRLEMIGVTGTDGKTTTANLIYQVLQAAGLQSGIISTVNAQIGGQSLDTGFHVTTPESPDVQQYLAQMVAAGLSHAVLEATSHGLAQHRVAACDFDVAVVTNITHEHLDYHGSYEGYRAAKARLFTGIPFTPQKAFGPRRGAVLNRDDESYPHLARVLRKAQEEAGVSIPVLSYGVHPEANVRPGAVTITPGGMAFDAIGPGFTARITTHLPGSFNISNCLAAVAVGMGILRLPAEAVEAGIASLPGVPGRMERIDLGQEFSAIVDFAHTPNALRRALEAARQMVSPPGRVIAVFGSAGLRDRAKRVMMAQTSVEMADLTVLTAEDPRTEDLDEILEEMAGGAVSRGGVEGNTFWRVPDRGDAIRFAVDMARPGDLVISCGKGHEQSMCFGVTEYSWDDRTAMRAALSERLGIPGPAMPYLPTQGN